VKRLWKVVSKVAEQVDLVLPACRVAHARPDGGVLDVAAAALPASPVVTLDDAPTRKQDEAVVTRFVVMSQYTPVTALGVVRRPVALRAVEHLDRPRIESGGLGTEATLCGQTDRPATA
jgi:hypothetical protein